MKILQLVASALLLTVVFWQVGLFEPAGREAFVEIVLQADWRWLLAAVLIGIIVNMSSALKWFMLIRARAMQVGYWRVFSYYLVGQFYNLILPTSVGGDVVRSWELGKFTGKQADALASVFVERYTGVLVLLIVAALAVLSQLSVFSTSLVIVSLLLFTVVLGLIAWMIFDARFYELCRDWLLRKLPASEWGFAKLDKLLASVQVYARDRQAIVWAFINSLVFYLLAVLNVYITALVFSADIELLDILIATPIIMLIMNIPISIGNIGLMEFAYSSIFALLGYSPAIGLSVAILMRLKSLLDGAMGGVLHPFFTSKKYSEVG